MKTKPILLWLMVVAICSCRVNGQQRFNSGRQFSVEEKETIRQTLEFSSGRGPKTLEVDTTLGAIHVTGYDGSTVEMTVNKTIRAAAQDDVRLAKNNVKLEVSDKADTISIYVDQPGRQRSARSTGNWSDPGYEVVFDFELRVPRATEIRLSNVLDEIRVQDMTGDFDVNSVTGHIDMTMVAGSGRVHTVNGPMDVKFSANPQKDSYFGTVNGVIDVTFPKDLSADLKFKTLNAGVYTDFPVAALPISLNTPERRNGMLVYRNEYQGVRIGKGGPMLEFNGLNGDIRIR